jgi:hypothetical protein
MKPKRDLEWEQVRQQAYDLNPEGQQFWKALNFEEYLIAKTWYGVFGILDPCHIYGKGVYPHMKYMIENILIAPRYFHSHIDQNRNCFTLQYMTEDEKRLFWIKFIGLDRYNYLEEKSRE